MASRYTSIKPLTKCLSPLVVYHDGTKFVVPCGKCSACLLNRANDWSMRVGAEVENNPYSIFFTLTYNNKYVPLMYPTPSKVDGIVIYKPVNNVRWNGTDDVDRRDDFAIFFNEKEIPVQNFSDTKHIAYCCKSDIQLWLKLLRKDIYDYFGEYQAFRYYIISEYGPNTLRPHFHGVLFPKNEAFAEYLLRISLYKNWAMCDKSLFDQYTHYCDSGCRGYVTEYITQFSDLPSLLREKSIKPFRLASKAPGIGFSCFNKKEVSEKVYQSTLEYTKSIERIDFEYILCYPKTYISRLFPKCYQYRLLSFERLLSVYGKLWRYVFKRGYKYEVVSSFLRKNLRSSDWIATLACYNFITNYSKPYVLHPFTFVYLVDMVYYKYDMFALKRFYEWQEIHANEPVKILCSYSNVLEYKRSFFTGSVYHKFVFNEWLKGFDVDPAELDSFADENFQQNDSEMECYRLEVEDITSQMTKMAQFNELTNNSPTTNF